MSRLGQLLLSVKLRVESLEERDVPSVDMGPIVNPANGHTYYRLTQSTWTAAEAEAVGLGGHLVTINDLGEDNWVFDTFNSANQYGLWIGFNDAAQEGHWVWVSGEPVTYTHWGFGQPDNFGAEDYGQFVVREDGQISPRTRTWNDQLDRVYEHDTYGGVLQGVVEVNTQADIHMISAQLQSGTTVQFTYETTGDPGPFEVGLYRSADGITYNPADLIDTQTATPSPTNPQAPGTFAIPGSYIPDADYPYLLAVADPSNFIAESDETNNGSSFQPIKIASLSLKDLDFSALQYLSVSEQNPYFGGNALILGDLKVTGNPLDSLKSIELEVIQNGTKVASADLGLLAGQQMLQAFGQAGELRFTSAQSAFIRDRALFTLSNSQAAGIDVSQNGSLTLRVVATSQVGAAAQDYTVQILTRFTGANRYGRRDEYPYGGDDWVLPSVRPILDYYSNRYGVEWGDISNMNGGRFPPHGLHKNGNDADGFFPGYKAINEQTARRIVQFLNDHNYGSRITKVFVAFRERINDPFYAYIKDLKLNNGIPVISIIRPDSHHKGHFHFVLSP